jgi:hypothetical protein
MSDEAIAGRDFDTGWSVSKNTCKLSALASQGALYCCSVLPRIGVENIVRSLADRLPLHEDHGVTVMTRSQRPDDDCVPGCSEAACIASVREFSADAIIQFGMAYVGWPLLLKRFPVLTSHQGWGMNIAIEPVLRRKLRGKMVRRSVNVCCSRAPGSTTLALPAGDWQPFNDKMFR